jgi:hypothetical protein
VRGDEMNYNELFEAYTKDFSVKYAARDALTQLDKLDCVKALKTCEYFVELMRLKCEETHIELMGLSYKQRARNGGEV